MLVVMLAKTYLFGFRCSLAITVYDTNVTQRIPTIDFSSPRAFAARIRTLQKER